MIDVSSAHRRGEKDDFFGLSRFPDRRSTCQTSEARVSVFDGTACQKVDIGFGRGFFFCLHRVAINKAMGTIITVRITKSPLLFEATIWRMM
jgi:hypothetical protein